MRTIMINKNPFNFWFNPLFDFWEFEPTVFSCTNPVKENITKTPFEYKIEYSIPDMKKNDLKITLDDDNLVVKGYKREPSNILIRKSDSVFEFSFIRSTKLTEDMDTTCIKARFKDGILSVRIPKKKEYIHYKEIPVKGDSDIEEAEVIEDNKPGLLEYTKRKLQAIFKKVA